MSEDIDELILSTKILMESSIDFLKSELIKVRTGKASASMLGGILVDYYGAPTPLSQVSNVSASDAKTLTIQPWEKTMLAPIEKAIFEANLGLTPQNNGEIIIINIPALTEERRKDFVKRAKALGEDAKISVRNARQETMKKIKQEVKDGYPEDAGKRKEDEVDDMTKKFTEVVDKLIVAKEKDIMTI